MIGKFVSADNGSEIIVSLLPHSFCWKEGEKVLVYDGEGRLFSFYQFIRRPPLFDQNRC